MVPRQRHGGLKSNKSDLQLFIVNAYNTAAEHFRVIENYAEGVIVPYGEEGKEIIAQLNGNESIENLSLLLRKAQRYTVNLFHYERQQLVKNGGLVPLLEGKIWVLKESAYHADFGVDLENDSGFGLSMY
jgi:CRISPR-associated endonuclease/helicase Cas3